MIWGSSNPMVFFFFSVYINFHSSVLLDFSYPSSPWILWFLDVAAATAKLLQSCPTLCDPIDSSPPGSPWDSPGKNTGVGCHFLLQCMKVKSESEVAQSCPTLCEPMDCNLPGSSIRGIFQARVLEWGAIAFSRQNWLLLLLLLLSRFSRVQLCATP